MKKVFIISFCLFFLFRCENVAEQSNKNIITSNITNLWAAYDAIIKTTDTAEQATLLRTLFIDKASGGQKGMILVKRYSEEAYLYSITIFPHF
jgi:hypothetical protein